MKDAKVKEPMSDTTKQTIIMSLAVVAIAVSVIVAITFHSLRTDQQYLEAGLVQCSVVGQGTPIWTHPDACPRVVTK